MRSFRWWHSHIEWYFGWERDARGMGTEMLVLAPLNQSSAIGEDQPWHMPVPHFFRLTTTP
jgi:hypothetical protein